MNLDERVAKKCFNSLKVECVQVFKYLSNNNLKILYFQS